MLTSTVVVLAGHPAVIQGTHVPTPLPTALSLTSRPTERVFSLLGLRHKLSAQLPSSGPAPSAGVLMRPS